MKRAWNWIRLVGQGLRGWLEMASGLETDMADSRFSRRASGSLMMAVLVIATWAASPPALAQEDTPQKHLTLDEIIVTEAAVSEPMGTAVGPKKIEKPILSSGTTISRAKTWPLPLIWICRWQDN